MLSTVTNILFLLSLTTKIALVFMALVFIRVTVPRLKFENLSKLGWTYSIMYLIIIFTVFLLGFVVSIS